MYVKKENGKYFMYVCVPRRFVTCDLKTIDEKLTSTFFVVYCTIDRWRTWNKDNSYYKTSVLNIMEDMGKPYQINSRKPISRVSNEIIYALEFMEENNMITLKRGDYHDVWSQFIIKVNKGFVDKKSVKLNIKYLDYILNSDTTIKKGNLLHVLLYALSTYMRSKYCDKETGELKQAIIQVYAESNKQTESKIGISDKTIANALKFLSGKAEEQKPLVVYCVIPYFHNEIYGFKSIPNIYTENRDGWKERINCEYNYFLKIREKDMTYESNFQG